MLTTETYLFPISIQQRFVEHNDKLSSPNDPTIGRGLKNKRGSKNKNVGILENNKKLVGKNTSVEKPYMRLTTAPKANDVRPLPVLRMALSHVKTHFIENEDFKFANEQLKSKFNERKHKVQN